MGYNILIADDLDLNRKIIKSILGKNLEGLTFFEAENGIIAKNIVTAGNIDLIILDLIMPEMNGYEFLQEIKSIDGCNEIPIIIHSALDDMESIKRTLEMGALDYFTFPLKPEEVSVKLPLKVKNALGYYEQKKALIRINEKNSQELTIANAFQTSLMTNIKHFRGYDMYGKYIPCSMVGGDLYDCVAVRDSLWFIIADVAGHGLVAAMISSMLKGMFDNCILNCQYPHEVLENMNRTLCKIFYDIEARLVSAFIGVIRDGVLYHSNAGHPYPIVVNCDNGNVKILEHNGYLLAMDPNSKYTLEKTPISRNDIVLSYTDGLFNLRNKNKISYWDRIGEYSLQNLCTITENPRSFLESLVDEFRRSFEKDYDDDVSIMLIQCQRVVKA